MSREHRITLCQRQPNRLFEHWLQQWLQMADQKQSMKRVALAKALESLQRYPLPLVSGRDCCILDGFGPEICRMLDKQLAVHREAAVAAAAEAGTDEVAVPTPEQRNESVREVLQIVGHQVAARQREKRQKRVAEATTSAVSVGRAKQPTVVDLFRKYRQGGGAEGGAEVAGDRRTVVEETEEQEKVVEVDCGVPEERIESGSYEIILLVDTCETAGKHKRSLDVTIQELESHQVRYEVRRLSVGDFLWICRCPATSSSSAPREFVLPHIVERKRMDDLAGSIKDGRFAEQKFRLRDSGIPGVVYLVEATRIGNAGLPVATLLQAATNTQVQSGFVVRFTQSHVDSMRYLVQQTRLLLEEYDGRPLRPVKCMRNSRAQDVQDPAIPVLEFGAFCASTTKMRNFRVRDMFVRQLLQLKTLTLEKALAIVQRYATPSRLVRALQRTELASGKGTAELLLAGLEFGVARRTIGPVISRCLYQLYTARLAS